MSDPELDDLGFALPEFRVSPRQGAGDEDSSSESDTTHNIPASELEDQLQDDAPSAGDEAVFDRAELVKTVRMDAFDRASVEGAVRAPQSAVTGYLEDQRFAPDVLVLPPRVLTKKWQDGAVVRRNGAPEPGGPALPSDRRALASTVRTATVDRASADAAKAASDGPPKAEAKLEAQAATADPTDLAETTDQGHGTADDAPSAVGGSPAERSDEALELDSEAIEDIADLQEVKPPPVKPQAPQESQKQRPGRARRNTGPLQKPEKTEVPQAQGDGDDDMSGIVQELLDEKKAKEPPKKRKPRGDAKRINWFNDVFSEEYFRTLSPGLKQQTKRDVQFIKDSLGLQKGARILDLACGFGRHSIELAKDEFEVAGLDVSMAMLQRALNEAQNRGLSIKFIHGDMRELNFAEIFDACFCWQTSFGYFDDRTNVQVAQGVARALKPGGRFLVDLVNRDYVVQEMPSRTWWEGHECVFLEEVEFDNNYSVLHTKRSFIYEDGSPPREFSSFIRLYSLHELRQLLHFSGFRVVEVSGATHHRGNFLGPTSDRLIVLAEKVQR